MKILGINFSGRTNGNCSQSLQFCLDVYKKNGHETKFINLSEQTLEPCGDCNYNCFQADCVKTDNFREIYLKMVEADKIIFAVPTYCGHLSSSFFIFSERSQGFYNHSNSDEDDILKKINLIIIGNSSSGGDMALSEALCIFNNRSYFPEVLLLSSIEYGRRSILGDLVEENEIRSRLTRFSNRIIAKGQ
jgi:multimeric flavodoxin WrbA